ncbi:MULTISPECIES: COX15/CtaA family protein [Ehrlichia]|uniref:Heme A synthase n=1 Tax=Ehrlichia cf. muris str. EmCRT TaxID=1359167 RepID=A0A0F3NCW9_9RICK|nr:MULTISPECIES: COX15/CtaA family protein [Ehrlichia]KJV65576.1 cytochrome oxidase assembly family protein [Ehrlichia cf. muris str. EmCRT]OUC04413.1 heme A synthase [Ehrlichia sp. Wisconsin_h]
MKITNDTKQVCISVKIWLCVCCVGILLMVLVGGITRLTHSGLSITEWNPIIGIFPPISEKAWIKEKIKYMATPEFEYLNSNITLQEFKTLYLIEYFHRLLGRVVGLILFIPFLYFTYKKKLNKNLIINFIIICLLILFQGIMGWLMVKSGLIDRPHVSHYKLTMHLLLALLIFYLLWRQFLLSVISEVTCSIKVDGTFIFSVISILIVIQITFGSLVAGLNAGLLYKTLPFLGGKLVLEDLLFMKPLWYNIIDNPVTVQFMHEVMAILILVVIVTALLRLKLNFLSAYLLLICLFIQLTLGILTFIYNVPIVIASLHQVTAFILFSINTYLLHCMKLSKLQCIR